MERTDGVEVVRDWDGTPHAAYVNGVRVSGDGGWIHDADTTAIHEGSEGTNGQGGA